jgi:hypothetical protein
LRLQLRVLANKSFNRTRKTAPVTIAKKSGVDIGIISDALGHQDTIVTRTYLDSFGSDDIDTANEEIIM